jgi:hypothetical protein
MSFIARNETPASRPTGVLRRGAARSLIGLVLTVSLSAPSVRADPLVCATVYFSLFGGPRTYVLNNQCAVPTPFPTSFGSGPGCYTDSRIQICDSESFAAP